MDSGECKKGYLGLEEKQQEYVRLALVNAVNANCENCPLGIDIERANFSISVFAQTLLANCGQAGQLVENFTGGAAGDSATYEDLWKFTLVNYNAGPGCLGDALDATQIAKQAFTWENISTHLHTRLRSGSGLCKRHQQMILKVYFHPHKQAEEQFLRFSFCAKLNTPSLSGVTMLSLIEKILFAVATLVSLYFTYRGVKKHRRSYRQRSG